MSGPRLSIVISPGDAAQRLGMSVTSAIAAGKASGDLFEVVIGLADADAPTREVAEALDDPRLRLSLSSVSTTRAAAAAAWGEIVIPLRGGDLLARSYVTRLVEVLDQGGDLIARPAACLTYGGAPAMRVQTSLGVESVDRARLVFGPPFAPPLAATRALLLRLSARPWDLQDDWAWTAQTLPEGVSHEVAEGSTYVAWSPPQAIPIALPPGRSAPGYASTETTAATEPASEAEVAALLYSRAAHARLSAVEAALSADSNRMQRMEGEAAALEATLAAALVQADQARGTMAALQASSSWKVTAPLRRLASFMHPGKR